MYDFESLEEDSEKLRRSGYFDSEWYKNAYPDVAMLSMDPAEHYLKYGAEMRRDPGPHFQTGFYLDTHPDMLPKNVNPVLWDARRKRKNADTNPRDDLLLDSAQRLARSHGYALAIETIERYLPQESLYVANILRANQAAFQNNESLWLQNLNFYFEHFLLSPLELLEKSGSILERLISASLRPIQNGPLVSVLMPCWNAKDTITYSARSILRQTWQPLELIIVDDASTDGTWKIVQQLAASDNRVKALRNSVNAGPYVSKNIAMSQARGDFITGHDADDWAHPQRIERQVAHADKHGLNAFLSGMLRMSPSGEFVRFNPIRGLVYDGATRGAFISLMMRSQFAHDLLGYWDQVRVGGDSELIRRIEKLEGRKVRVLQEPTMLCLDNPEGLTNHPVLGHSESGGVSPVRVEYKQSFLAAHAKLKKTTCRFDFPLWKRPFPAPPEICASTDDLRKLVDDYSGQITLKTPVDAEIVIATDLRFPGGNASSTLDEIATFVDAGLTVSLINCPVDNDLGKPLSERYESHTDLITTWSRLERARCKVFICRHPKVATSVAFRHIAPLIEADAACFVKNNSSLRSTGESVYDIGQMVASAKCLNVEKLLFCPISPVMRTELQSYEKSKGIKLPLSDIDWTPTFDLALYKQVPKKQMVPPFRIGRHGRDGAEKWQEDPALLLQAFPDSSDFSVHILGGAANAEKIVGTLPCNWRVHDFGSIEPFDYLRDLDAFVYFPNTGLSEGFGRTIVEAMLAGVPVILPPRFAATFDDLPLYSSPQNVANMVRHLAQDDNARRHYLEEVQSIAIARYSSAAIERRFIGTGLWERKENSSVTVQSPSQASLMYRKSLMERVI